MTKKGWIKLHRSILESDIWAIDASFCPRSAFIDLILRANHENGNAFNKKPISRGQHWTSLRKLSERWHWHRLKVKTFLERLQCEGMISAEFEPLGVLITILNYDKWQEVSTDGRTDVLTNGRTNGRTDVLTNGRQTRMIKNDIKKDKEIKGGGSSKWQK